MWLRGNLQDLIPGKKYRVIPEENYKDLKQQRDDLIALIWELKPKYQHDHDYFHNDCTLCGMEKLRYEKIDAAIAKCKP